jgi:hypothetical protein
MGHKEFASTDRLAPALDSLRHIKSRRINDAGVPGPSGLTLCLIDMARDVRE